MVKLVAVLRRLKPDVVLSSIVHLNLALLLIRPFLPEKCKIYVRESNTPSIALSKGRKEALFRLLCPLLYPQADGIICPGEAVKRDLGLTFRISPKRIIAIPNPVYVHSIRSRISEDQVHTHKNGPKLLAMGSLTRQKGFDLLVDAMAKLVKIRPHIQLIILGTGPEKANLVAQIQKENLTGCITLAGFKDNPYPYFYNADLFVLSSRWEGLPNVVLESLACGTPVVAFDCPGCVNEIFDGPAQGVLVPDGDVSALVKAIDLRLQFLGNTYKDSLLPDRFEARSVTSQYENILAA
jgi:glycosyltransferase involved in cell wall biosynthesis